MHHVGTAVRRAAGVRWGGPAREPRDGEVEGAPEEVHGADLAEEPAAEHLEDAIHLDERPPEPLHLLAVVRRVLRVLLERDGVGDLHRHRPHGRGQPEPIEVLHQLGVEVGDGARSQVHRRGRAVRHRDVEAVGEEVEVDLEGPGLPWDERRRQATGRHIQRHVPPVVHHGCGGQAHLADDLRPQLQRVSRRLPLGDGQRRPRVVGGHAPPASARPGMVIAPCCRTPRVGGRGSRPPPRAPAGGDQYHPRRMWPTPADRPCPPALVVARRCMP